MNTFRWVALAACIVIPGLAWAGPKAKDDGAAEARTAIEAANAKFAEAFERGDAKALAAMYTTDAIAFPPGAEMVLGNEAIGAFWKKARESGVHALVLTTSDVGRDGDVAYEVGKVGVTVQAEGKEPAQAVSKYVVVWKRQADGAWKLHRDIWNDLPSQ